MRPTTSTPRARTRTLPDETVRAVLAALTAIERDRSPGCPATGAIANRAGLSLGVTHDALRQLAGEGVVVRASDGRRASWWRRVPLDEPGASPTAPTSDSTHNPRTAPAKPRTVARSNARSRA